MKLFGAVLVVGLVGLATWNIDSPLFWLLWTVFWSWVWIRSRR